MASRASSEEEDERYDSIVQYIGRATWNEDTIGYNIIAFAYLGVLSQVCWDMDIYGTIHHDVVGYPPLYFCLQKVRHCASLRGISFYFVRVRVLERVTILADLFYGTLMSA